MGTKYSTQTVSGYNATPPSDDGTASEANKVKWSTHKTKLTDPLNTAIAAINTALLTALDPGPVAYTTNQTLGATHYGQFIQVSNSSVTLTLSDAATLGIGWYCDIFNTDVTNSVTLARATGGDTLDGVASNYTIKPLECLRVFVIVAANGFRTSKIQNLDSPSHSRNLGLAASVGSNALTVSLKGKDGNDPSSTNPVIIAFRNATSATGDYSTLAITSATSIVISSGSTMGTTSGVISRFWVVAFNDSGTFRMGLINCLSSTSIYPLMDDILASSTAEGGAGAADSAGVFYTGTAVTSKAMRVLGYIELTEATAGTYATTPSKIQLWTMGMKLPGDVVQQIGNVTGTVATGQTRLPSDNTTPQNTEGDQFMTQAITPTSSCNMLRVVHTGNYSHNNANTGAVCLFRDTTANAVASSIWSMAANYSMVIGLVYSVIAGSTSATTFKIRAGSDAATGTQTFTFNGINSGALFNGTLSSELMVYELMG